ncbi:MAG: hydantoinase/oxoprolinase family protein [Sphingobium sp.]
MVFTIDIDTGGTFTDGFIADGSDVRTVKVPTTPHDLTKCFIDCIEAGAAAFGRDIADFLYFTDIIRFSNTIGTNTIIQRNGAKIGLLVTAGKEGLAPTVTDGKSALITADMVIGLEEKADEDGVVWQAPDRNAILEAAQALVDRGARGLVVAFDNSDANPANERLVRDVVKAEYPRDYLGSVSTFLASDISARSGDRERINAAVLNAYIHSKLARLLYKAGEELRLRGYRGTLFIGHNNGAVARVAKTRAINTYNSGPAGGLYGAQAVGRLYGADTLISTDMGGTSFDIGYVKNGHPSYALRPEIEGFACNLPMMAIDALGAGGGSIAEVVDGVLRVGPQSAGALPGPASFGLGGTKATVTDANLVLGILDADHFLGGGMKLDPDKARTAIEAEVAGPLGISVEEAALAIRQTVERSMGEAVSAVADRLERPEGLPVIAYGGAGAIHAADIATIAGVDKVVITPFSAVSSAFGSSLMDVGHIYYRRTDGVVAMPEDIGSVAPLVEAMAKEGARDMRGEGFDEKSISSSLQLFWSNDTGDREFVSTSSIDALLDNELAEQIFDEAAATMNGHGPARLASVGYLASASVPHFQWNKQPPAKSDTKVALRGERQVWLGGDATWVPTPVYDRAGLANGHEIAGPAIAESSQTTIFVPPGWRLRIDEYDNALLERD